MSNPKSLPVHRSVIAARAKETAFIHRAHSCNGALVVITDVYAHGPLSMSVCIPDRAQLGVMLEQVGGVCEPRIQSGRPRKTKPSAHEINFAPVGVRTWGESEQIETCKTISMLFEPSALLSTVYGDDKLSLPDEPWLGVTCEPIARLAKLLAAEVEAPPTLNDLYADSLVVAITAQLCRRFALEGTMKHEPGLSTTELKRVLSYIEDNIATSVRLQDVVSLTSMSQSAFCAAFKRATGIPPHRYQLSARVRRAQARMLAQPSLTLSELASELGFADQAHFGRVFRSFAGESPAFWLRSRRGGAKGSNS